ncbi:hypothetical protein NL388_29985, partial [Klebsiella pneumoniae]|nr:hypothetical protein [Klebsiella pneumoniae]
RAAIVGASRQQMTPEAFVAFARSAITEYVPAGDLEDADVARFLARLTYVPVEAEGEGGWERLAALIATHTDMIRVFYLATGPALFGPICTRP